MNSIALMIEYKTADGGQLKKTYCKALRKLGGREMMVIESDHIIPLEDVLSANGILF